jgi:putative N6-adenine-specific DNA methylase
VFLYWRDDGGEVYLNTSGEPLQRRGYRTRPHRAPLQETLAAALVAAMGQKPGLKGHFVNPMCGSGTLAIEAVLARRNTAPGLLREAFAFRALRGFDAALWETLREEARKAELGGVRGLVVATDRDPAAVDAARRNAVAAGVGACIEFAVCDFRDTDVPEGAGVAALNPEYGERLGDERQLTATYAAIGDFFKQRCQGYTGYVFTGNPELGKRVGLRAARRLPFWNSTIECRLLEYEMYSGSRPPGPAPKPASAAEPVPAAKPGRASR